MLKPLPFRFDQIEHVYSVNGEPIPHITGMMLRVGEVDDTWFTDDASERGRAVHGLTAEYDLGALDVASLVSRYRGWVLAHVKAVKRIKPTWISIEEPEVHPQHRFGGRPDRVAKCWRKLSIVEEKTGAKEKSHRIQTALQVILEAWKYGLPIYDWDRYCLYVHEDGSYELDSHHLDKARARKDFKRAFEIIETCCGKVAA